MKSRILMVMLAGSLLFGLPIRHALLGQTCTDDEGMVKSYVQSITSLIGTVKKESLPDFEKDYHEQSCLTRLNLSLGIVDSLIDCLNKAEKDTTATQEQIAAIKSKLQTYTKLKTTLQEDRDALKGAKNTKTAKAIIEKFTLST